MHKEKIDQVLTYLGSIISEDGESSEDVRDIIAKDYEPGIEYWKLQWSSIFLGSNEKKVK